MDSSVTSDGNLCLLAGYPGIFGLDFRASDSQIDDLSAGLNFPRKINCVQFSRAGEQFAITHDNPSCCLSVFDLRKFSEPLYSVEIDDKLGKKRFKTDFWQPILKNRLWTVFLAQNLDRLLDRLLDRNFSAPNFRQECRTGLKDRRQDLKQNRLLHQQPVLP